MTKEEISKSIIKPVIEWAVKKIFPLLLSILVGLSSVFLSIKNKLVEHPYILLVLMAIMTATTVLFLILWVRLYWLYERLEIAFGVKWDKKYNMRCMNCEKPLKYSTSNSNISKYYSCPDEKNCNSKYVLRNDYGGRMGKHQAIELLKRRKQQK